MHGTSLYRVLRTLASVEIFVEDERNSLAVLGLAVLATSTWAQKLASKADFDAFTGYFTAGSAIWQQDNSEPGESEPTH